ncbi:MAG: hypothetical protein A3K65_05305 [Euryarchaeota archaeon RBG_16_68_12]|nr:MAG: hypothetical protein A3K65_05305 [Euryarchaeota archaeon RBG_16_68_12]
MSGAALLAFAAVSDWRTREVRDRVWVWMGTLGLILFGADLWLGGVDPVIGLVLVPTAVLLYDPLFGQEFRTEDGGWRFQPAPIAAFGIAAAATAYAIYDLQGDPAALGTFYMYLTAPVMMLVFRGMYELHLLKGGADAKAMIAIAALVPTYPEMPSLPLVSLDPRLQDALRVLFPFSLLVLMNAALFFVVAPIAFLAYNARRGNLEFPKAILGYKVPLDAVPKHAWFMDQIEEGGHVVVYFPKKRQDREGIAKALRDAGFTEAWVTPQLPFIVAITASFVFSFLVGNVLMGLLQLVLPAP